MQPTSGASASGAPLPWWLAYASARARGASKTKAAAAAGSMARDRGALHRWAVRAEAHEVVRAVIEGAQKRAQAAAEAYLATVRQHALLKQPIPR